MGERKYERWLTPESLLLLEGWARDGLSYEQIAHNCGCNVRTLWKWRARYPALAEALRKGREVVDYAVENAMLKRALGYQYTETRTETGADEKVVQTEKHMPPNVNAAAFWLRNRKPEVWNKPKDTAAEDTATGCVILPEADGDE